MATVPAAPVMQMDAATVTQVTPSLMVKLHSSTTSVPAKVLGSYTPLMNDQVSTLSQGGQLFVVGGQTPTMPPATVIFGYWSAAPAGYLDCDGASYSRTLYPALSAAIATGGSTFTVPNIPSGTYITGGTPGAASGSATHTLSTAEMPSHNHTQDPHDHDVDSYHLVAAGTGAVNVGGAFGRTTTSSTTATNNATGGGGSFSLAPKSLSLRFVIKY